MGAHGARADRAAVSRDHGGDVSLAGALLQDRRRALRRGLSALPQSALCAFLPPGDPRDDRVWLRAVAYQTAEGG